MASDSSRKRLKGANGQPIDVTLSTPAASEPVPAFALFPGGQPPASTSFQLYTRSGKSVAEDGEGASLIAAETGEMEYESRNQLGSAAGGDEALGGGEDAGHSVQYMLGVHNPRTNTLTLHAAPLHTLSSSIKALKSLPSTMTPSQFQAQRALLGTTFGTKKAIRSLNAEARNKLDSSSFGNTTGLQAAFQSAIASSSASLPAKEIIERLANAARPIPPPNMDASSPEECYSISDIVTPAELNAFPLEAFLAAKTFKDRNALLPFRRSDYLSTHIRQLLPHRVDGEAPKELSSKQRETLKLLIHISFLLQFRSVARPGNDANLERSRLTEKLGNPAPVIVSNLLERYSESQRVGGGVEKRKVTTLMEIKSLGYLGVLMLKVDRWSTDVSVVAKDLGMGQKKVADVFRSLGCSLVTPTVEERHQLVALGRASNASEARKCSKARLRVPLTFPVDTRGKSAKR